MTTERQTAPQSKPEPRFNALKHGIYSEQQIMFDENADDLAELAAEYHEHHAPANPTERELVDTLIHNEWRLRRMRRVEAVLWEHAANTYLTQNPEQPGCNSAEAFVSTSAQFERLQRIVNACEKNYHRALKELRVAQSQPLAQRTPQPQENTATSPFRQNPNPPTPAPPPAARNATAPPAKEAVEADDMDDETFRLRREAMFAAAMAKYGKK
jgi:hypothetical protein